MSIKRQYGQIKITSTDNCTLKNCYNELYRRICIKRIKKRFVKLKIICLNMDLIMFG